MSERVTCPACIELQMEAATEMAEFERLGEAYFKEVGDLLQAALCQTNGWVYRARAEQCANQLRQLQAA